MKLLLVLMVGYVYGCTRLADDIHNEAPTFNPAGSSLTAANGVQLSFNVNCNYKAGSENASGQFKIRGGSAGTTNALQAGTAGTVTGDNRVVVVKNTWASVYAYADAQSMIQSSGSQTRITMMVDFHGVSRNLSDGASGSIAVQRTIDEIYSVYALFTNTVTVENAFVFVYAAVAVEVTLVSTTALISDSWQKNGSGADTGTVTVAIILQTAVAAPFKIVAPAASIDYDGNAQTNNQSPVNLTGGNAPVEQGALSGECTGPYTTGTATGNQQKTGVAICRQKWLMKVAVVLATRCKLDNAKLVFGKDGGIACGSAATDSICPLNQDVTVDTDDDFTSDLTISTSDACPTFGMTSTACGSINTEDPSTSNTKTVFVQGDTVQLDLELGTVSTEGSTQEMKSFKTYITTVGTNECDGTDCVNSYYFASTACAFSTAYTSGSCTVQCHDNLDIVLNTNDYNITPNPAQSGATTTITFTATLFIFYEDITAYSYTEPFTQASANNAPTKKKTLDLSTSRSSMYALLQEASQPESIMIDAEVGFGVANAEEVAEDVDEPATEGVKPEMAIEEESSSNLVYIVVGVLLVLSVGIAAVVMYMRRSKNGKKVVPVPITVEVRNASSTV